MAPLAFKKFSEEDMETVEAMRRITSAAGSLVCAVISYAITDSVKNNTEVETKCVALGDEILAFMHEPAEEL